jgi:hypothetical protein
LLVNIRKACIVRIAAKLAKIKLSVTKFCFSEVQGDQKIGKNCPNFGKSSQNSWQVQNCQNNYIKAQFESTKHLHKTTFKT